ncbi:MAG: prolipoprotein diacylglyceryl transferase [Xanthomonadales bacterium]|nr:prolipoprotein diacylglyceryl transferase [Xanthomonadales bacterium]
MPLLHEINPVALNLGPLQVHWYGLMYLLAFALAWWLGRRRIRAGFLPGVSEAGFSDLMFYGMLGVILGGRIGYILFYDFGTYLQHPLQVFEVWKGGMSFHGGLIGVMLAAWYWARKQGMHFFDVADFIVPLAPPGLGFGRIGNFINGELWGKLTSNGWGVVFPQSLPAPYNTMSSSQLHVELGAGALNQYARHPSQLYEALLEGLVMFLVLWFFSKKPRHRFAVSGMFLLLYGVFRFVIEFVRIPDEQLKYLAFGWLTMGQLLSVPLILAGLFLLWKSRSAPVLRVS